MCYSLINVLKITDSLSRVALTLSLAVDCWATQAEACSRACTGANELVPIGHAVCVGRQTHELRLGVIM